MARYSELRVHGVSGTPPRAMLYTDPTTLGDKSEFTRVFSPPVVDKRYDTKAFHWGGLTSGSWTTAFWILLAPFVFANVAGWMATRTGRFHQAMIRLAGLGLTALFTAQAVTALVLMPFLWLQDRGLTPSRIRWSVAALVVVVGGGYLFIVWRFSTRTHFDTWGSAAKLQLLFGTTPDSLQVTTEADPTPELDRSDPAGKTVADSATWTAPPILHRLRRIHLGVGLAVIALAAGAFTGHSRLWIVIAGVVAILVVIMVATSFWPGSSVVLWATGLAPWLGVAALGSSLGSVLITDAAAWNPAGIHKTVLAISGALFVVTLASLGNGLRTVGALVIGTQLGGVLGIAAGLIMERLLGLARQGDLPETALAANGAGWVAVAMLVMIEVLLFWALLTTLVPADKTSRGWEGLLRHIVLRSHQLLRVAALYGLTAGAIAVYKVYRCDNLSPLCLGNPDRSEFHQVVIVVAILVGVLAMLRLYAFLAAAFLKALAIGAGVVFVAGSIWLGLTSWLNIKGFSGPGLVEVATTIAIVVPGAAMFRSIFSGVSEGQVRRRKVGILWDLGSFWPRWYHPLAPPAYGPIAVSKLRDELNARPQQILAAHSQGSLIAAVTLSQIEDGSQPTGFLTYGSQLGELYPKMFPAAGIDALVNDIAADPDPDASRRYPDWINLWRDSDPIGGHYVKALGDYEGDYDRRLNRIVTNGRGHFRYEQTEAYTRERDRIMERVPEPSSEPDLPTIQQPPS